MTNITEPQFNALHVYCQRVADALNDAGFDQKAVLEAKSLPAPNTKESIKEIFKAIQAVMFPPEGEVSTTRLTTGQVSQIYEVFNRWLGEHFGIHVPFPNKDER